MSEQVPGVGQLSDVPRPVENPRFEGLQLSAEDWFLLSRIDGQTSVRDLFTLSPAGRPQTIEILKRLAEHALIVLPARQTTGGSSAPQGGQAREVDLPEPPRGWPTRYADFTVDPALLAEDTPLSADYRKMLLFYHAHLERVSYYELLGVPRDASGAALKRAYFKLSKLFHPDRFFRQDLGSFGGRLNEVFRWLNEAQKTLGNKTRRADYDAQLARGVLGPWHDGTAEAGQASTSGISVSAELARRPLAELLGEGKRLERSEDFRGAVEHYEAALAQRESAELMNRIAECQVRLRSDLEHAERRARGAIALSPQTARYLATLAYIFELQGAHDEAIASYRRALEIDPGHRGAQTRLERLLSGS